MNEYIEAKDLEDFRDEIMSEFLSLCNYNDYNKITLLGIGETIDKIYDKYYSKPLADVESKREWIPVTERLPEETCECLIIDRLGIICLVPYSSRYKAFNATDDDGGDQWKFDSITHWMPLPEPPEAEKGR